MYKPDFNVIADDNHVIWMYRYKDICSIENFYGTKDEAIKAIEAKFNNQKEVKELYLKYVEKLYSDTFNSIEQDVLNNTLADAATKGHLDVLKYLVSIGADIPINDINIMTKVTEYGRLDILQYIEANGGDLSIFHNMCLRTAVLNGQLDILKYLISKYPTMIDAVLKIIFTSHCDKQLDMVEFLVNHGAVITNMEYLHLAVEYNNFDMVKYLVSKGVPIKADDHDILLLAIESNNLDMVKYLVSKGIDVTYDNNAIMYIFKQLENSTYPCTNSFTDYSKIVTYIYSLGKML